MARSIPCDFGGHPYGDFVISEQDTGKVTGVCRACLAKWATRVGGLVVAATVIDVTAGTPEAKDDDPPLYGYSQGWSGTWEADRDYPKLVIDASDGDDSPDPPDHDPGPTDEELQATVLKTLENLGVKAVENGECAHCGFVMPRPYGLPLWVCARCGVDNIVPEEAEAFADAVDAANDARAAIEAGELILEPPRKSAAPKKKAQPKAPAEAGASSDD